MTKCNLSSIIIFSVFFCGQIGCGSTPVPSVPFRIPGDDSAETATDFSGLLEKPAGASGFVRVKDGHFFVGDQRLRFWGMNLCFGANFPTHEQADKGAPHLAKLGCNAGRFHHMDMQDAPEGIWKTNDDRSRTLSPEQVDRLDYFLAKLHENGIYANLNLHVSRTLTEAEGFPQLKDGPWWAASNKWVMYYDPDVQAELKQYCRDLLGHTNPYRNLKRTDDPGIALIEMLNENFFSVKGTTLLKHLPDRFLKSYLAKWNQWLRSKYDDHEKLATAWQPDADAAAAQPIIATADWKQDLGSWMVQPEANVSFKSAKFDESVSAIRIEPKKSFEQHHSQQLITKGLQLEANESYQLSFWIRSDRPRPYTFEVSSTEGGQWRDMGLFETSQCDPTWVQVKQSFVAKETTTEAFLAINIGTSDVPVELANVSLIGASIGEIPTGQRLENANIGVPDNNYPKAAIVDHQAFLVDTERAWVTELRDFLKNELGVKVPITASQENYHAPGLLAQTVDYVDLHNYWHHPTFPPGRDFNPTDYRTGNVPLETQPLQVDWPARSLIPRTGWRYHGMPFTLSEWNHPEPGDANTGAIMMAATVGALQDWDGVFFFDYDSGTDRWFKDHFEGFFGFNSQPVKLAAFSVAANIFLRGDLPALSKKLNGTFQDRCDGRLSLEYQLGVDVNATVAQTATAPEALLFKSPDESLVWDATDTPKSYLQLNTPKSQGVWGLVANEHFKVGVIDTKFGPIDHNYGTLVLTALDDQPIATSGRLLLLASSGAENTNMQWNADRTSVSDQWGTGPTRVNLVSAKIKLALGSKFSVHALDGTGKRTSQVEAKMENGKLVFEIGSPHNTIWYELTKE